MAVLISRLINCFDVRQPDVYAAVTPAHPPLPGSMPSRFRVMEDALAKFKALDHPCVAVTAVVGGCAMVLLTGLIMNLLPYFQVIDLWAVVVVIYTVAIAIGVVFLLRDGSGLRIGTTGGAEEDESSVTLGARCAKAARTCEFQTLLMSSVASLVCFFLVLVYIFPESFEPTSPRVNMRRVASVSANAASFWARDSARTSATLMYRQASSASMWLNQTQTLSPATDNTAFYRVEGLQPATIYEWRFAEEPFTTIPSRTLVTAPAPGTSGDFVFYFGSCFVARFPNLVAPPVWSALAARRPAYILWLGDFIYSDHPVMHAGAVNDFRAQYRAVLVTPDIGPVLADIPQFYMFDDHEILNNWDGGVSGRYPNAMRVWAEYLGGGNPGADAWMSDPGTAGRKWFVITYGDVETFVLDTRSHRDRNGLADSPSKTMLGSFQKAELLEWLGSSNATFKFIASTVPWTISLDTSDGWFGFAHERDEILDSILARNVSGVILLSADQHFVFSKAELRGHGSGLFEFGSSPLGVASDGGIFGLDYWVTPTGRPDERPAWYAIERGAYSTYLITMRCVTNVSEPYVVATTTDGSGRQLRQDTVTLSETLGDARRRQRR